MTVHTIIDRRGDDGLNSNAQATNSAAHRALYAKREPIYPKMGNGPFRTLKWAALFVLLAIYYATPWLRWDRGPGAPDQAVLIDFEGRRFYFFFIELWPQEIYYIAGLLIAAAISIFLSSALFGRVWCGYACPQTVWTDLYLLVERWIEGDRAARMRLARAPLNADKIGKKAAKHTLWLLIAMATGGAWVFYFADAPTLLPALFTGDATVSAYISVALLTFTTYALAGTMREQVCTYMCPWPRIQAAMTDKHALSVTYRHDRGEPRAPHKKGATWEGRGDCIDCRQCIAVCPQGIDIRDGDQLECINCALCIDACDTIMRKVGRPTGLIAYDSFENVALRAEGRATPVRFIRPRTIVYTVALAIVSALMLEGLLTRDTLALDAIRDRNPPLVRLASGDIRNGYTLRVINKANISRTVSLAVAAPADAQLRVMDAAADAGGAARVRLAPDGVTNLRAFITMPARADRTSVVQLVLTDPETGEGATREVSFMSGGSR